jgi:hypothetical protein
VKDILTIGSFGPWIGWLLLAVGLGTMFTFGYLAYLQPALQQLP